MCDGLYNGNRQLRMVFAQFKLRKYEEKKYYYPIDKLLTVFRRKEGFKIKKEKFFEN